MYSKPGTVMPPLWIWLLLAIVTAASVAGLAWYVSDREDDEYSFRRQYLQSKQDSSFGRPFIVFLGSSLTQCGIDTAGKIETLLATHIGTRPVVAKIWRRATTLDELTQEILQQVNIKPELLVIESNMMFYSANPQSIWYKLSLGLRQVRRGKPVDGYNVEEKPKSKGFDNRDVEGFRGNMVEKTGLKNLKAAIDKLAAAGTRVILLHFPIEEREEHIKWSSPDTSLFQGNLNYMASVGRHTTRYLQPPFGLDSTHFMDKAHMNTKGANTFTRWLCIELAKVLNQP